MDAANKITQGTTKKVFARIHGHGRGWVFTPSHFSDLGGRSTISTILQRYHNAGMIRQLARGLYDYPKHDPKFGILTPSADDIAKALAGRDAVRLQPSGAYAANLLGLSTHVPTRTVYLTDGRSRTVQMGNRQIVLKRTTPRNMATAGKISGLVIHALRHLGKKFVDDDVVAQLDRRLDDEARKQLLKDIRFAPIWIADIFRKLARDDCYLQPDTRRRECSRRQFSVK